MHHLTSTLGTGVAQAAASVREPAVAASAAEPSLRNLVESYAQEAGMEFLPKARQHEGLQVSLISLTLAPTARLGEIVALPQQLLRSGRFCRS